MRQLFVAGNWKMNGSLESVNYLLKSIKARCNEITKAELAVFPPYVFMDSAATILADTNVSWGAQNVSDQEHGAFTGEVSTSMLKDFGCRYVIVGHSERRALYGETNEVVAKKCKVTLDSGLIPVLCVGESLAQRESGVTLQVVTEQLDAVLALVDNHPALKQVVTAYEPVWAIGTGMQATPRQAQEVHCAIRERLNVVDSALADQMRILYGGSVKPDNAAGLFAMPDIDGALVGGASLDADKFIEIALCSNSF